jgi:integral membrane protein
MGSTLTTFKNIARLEGISFLILLCIAMPLKYFANMPLPVRVIGSVHGLLFVFFIILLYLVKEKYNWGLGKCLLAFVASILPFGTFIFEKKFL